MRAYFAQARAELLWSLRQGEQMLVAIGIPILILVFFSLVDVLPRDGSSSGGDSIDALAPSVLALAIMSTAMVSLGIGTGFERYYGVLKRLGVTPLGRPRLVLAKITMVLAVEVLQIAILVPVALALGWDPGGPIALAVPAYVLGTAAFAGIGLLMAGTLKGTVNLALCNALYVVLLLFGGIVVQVDQLPNGLQAVARLLPSGALSEVLHASLTPGAAAAGGAWLVLVAWAVAMPAAAAACFRWD